jgi:hypothetical protein
MGKHYSCQEINSGKKGRGGSGLKTGGYPHFLLSCLRWLQIVKIQSKDAINRQAATIKF